MESPSEVSAATRAKMVANRRVDTQPELLVRRAVHRHGLRFRKDFRIALGRGRADPRPDLVFTRVRLAVFIDGCFWHGCPRHGHVPKSNSNFWTQKFARNAERDRENDHALATGGWRVLRVWEHVPAEEAAERILEAYHRAEQNGAG